jgi:AcrR family transcriptional regulator
MSKRKTTVRTADPPPPVERNGRPPAEREARQPVEAIRAAAFAQFAERGYPVVTVRDIMKACGLTQGALYNHFKSKDELLHDIIASTQAELERVCQQAVAGAGDDPRAKLAAFVRVYVVRHCRLRVEALVANREIGWLDSERVADIRRSRRDIRDILVGVLAEGVERGAFDPPQVDGRRDLKALAMALLDQCTHISMWYGPGGHLSEEQMARLYADMALRAAGARPSGN